MLGVPDADELGQTMILLADPYSFATEALLDRLDELRPGMPVLGGLASASAAGSASLFRNGDVLTGGAVACSLSGRADPAVRVSGRRPGRPGDDDHRRGAQRDRGAGLEARDRAASRGARRPRRARAAARRLRSDARHRDRREPARVPARRLPGAPDHRRRRQRPGRSRSGERVRVGQTVRMHIRDGASADEDLRETLRAQVEALGSTRPAGVLLFTCNGRGSHMFEVPDHDASAVEDALGRPGRRILLRWGDRAGGGPQLPPRLHGDDGPVRGRVGPAVRRAAGGTVAPMPDREQLRDLVARALAEDLGAGDITSEATVPADARANATDRAKAARRRLRARGRRRGLCPGRRRGLRADRDRGASGATRSPPTSRRSAARPGRCSPPSARRSTCSATSRGWRR